MSRTIRRKNQNWLRDKYVIVHGEDRYILEWMIQSWIYSSHKGQYHGLNYKQIVAKKVAWFHGDYARNWNAPKAYRCMLNKEVRNANKHELYRAVNDLEQDVCFTPYKRTANWYFW